MVSFDLDEVAWERAEFSAQQGFLLRMIDVASQRHRWEVLRYDPPYVQGQLHELRALVEQYRAEYVEGPRAWEWRAGPPTFERCPTHQIYLHPYGCLLCNDM